MAEKYIKKHHHGVKTVILRPSIIASSLEQPFKGWTDSISAAGGLSLLATLGILKNIYIPKSNPFDLIPVDIVSNSILLACAYHGGDPNLTPSMTIYHCSTSSQNAITTEGYKEVGLSSIKYIHIFGQVMNPVNAATNKSLMVHNARRMIQE